MLDLRQTYQSEGETTRQETDTIRLTLMIIDMGLLNQGKLLTLRLMQAAWILHQF